MKQILISISAILLFSCTVGEKTKNNSMENTINYELKSAKGKTFGFYNVENLFDTIDSKYTIDEAFLPSSEKEWNTKKYKEKLENLAKVIRAFDSDFPVFLGMAEIENRVVIEDLITKTKLKKGNYGIVHHQSPDKRGIDVGFIYRKEYFKVLENKAIEVAIEGDEDFSTRDILYVKGEMKGNDIVHVFLNHWSSRRAGQKESEYKRVRAATILRGKVDKILAENKNAKIIILGDFNDYPSNKSIYDILRAKDNRKFKNGNLYNMAYNLDKDDKGTYNYRGDWGMLDQMIISRGIFNSDKGVEITYKDCKVLKKDWMLYTDKKYKDQKPSKSYGGSNYYGGYSDHLPILSRFEKED